MKVTLTIDCDNSAFRPDAGAEIARILREAADKVEDNSNAFNLFDLNGNKVGNLTISGSLPFDDDDGEQDTVDDFDLGGEG